MRMQALQLTKAYKSRSRRGEALLAADHVDLELREGETIGLFGDSGSGKSTIGQMLSGLLKPTSGQILYNGRPISCPFHAGVRRDIQILFQHPEVSFNPALPLDSSMREPYQLYHLPFSQEILVHDIEQMGLHEEHLSRKPAELSGGELQRAALSRLLVLAPKVIVLDEPTSMLDVITQAQIIQILRKYQERSGASYVFITHNRTLCEKVCDRIYQIELGRAKEESI